MGSSLIAFKATWIVALLAAGVGAVQSLAPQDRNRDPATIVKALDADLLAHASATEVLGHWCADHHLADPPVIKALRDKAVTKPASGEVRTLLRATPGEEVRYRHVRLTCGVHVLSEADNWYLPDRLTPDMNRQLDQSDTPFGIVVKPLNFHRRRIEARVLILPISVAPQPFLLRHRAVLTTGEGAPFSVVVEQYTRALLD